MHVISSEIKMQGDISTFENDTNLVGSKLMRMEKAYKFM